MKSKYINNAINSLKHLLLFSLIVFVKIQHSNAQSMEWVKAMVNGEGKSIALKNGYVYSTGTFSGTADFDPGPGVYNLYAVDFTDIYVSKLDPAGNLVWAVSIGSNRPDGGTAIAVNDSGDIYVCGFFSAVADFNPAPGPAIFQMTSTGLKDAFILQLDTLGNFKWAKKMGGANDDQANSIVLDANGNVYTTGYFEGAVDFDPGPGTFIIPHLFDTDVFLSKLDINGNLVWAKSIAGTQEDFGKSIAIYNNEFIYVAGKFRDSVDFDPSPGTMKIYTPTNGAFVTAFDSAGNYVWVNILSITGNVLINAINTDPIGNIYGTGSFRGMNDFDYGPGVSFYSTATGYDDVFIFKLNSVGDFQWAKTIGGSYLDFGLGIAVDSAGNSYTVGLYSATADFDPGPGVFNRATNINTGFIEKLDISGNFVWAKTFGGNQSFINSVVLNDSGSVFTTGKFYDTVDFEPGVGVYNLVPAFYEDVFVHKLRQCLNTFDTITVTACKSYLSPSGSHSWISSGMYSDVILNADGCDSIITINLTIYNVNTQVNKSGDTLKANQSGLTYQWIDCNNGNQPVAGANGQFLVIPPIGGNYAVIVSDMNCTDTSDCINVFPTGILQESSDNHLSLYPNPTNGKIFLGGIYKGYITLYNTFGKKLCNMKITGNEFDFAAYPEGVYFLRVQNELGSFIRKIVIHK